MEYLDFELPIKEIQDQLSKCEIIGSESEIDVTDTCAKLELKLKKTKEKIYGNLTPWQRVQLSRHPSRPYTLDYIKAKNRQISYIGRNPDATPATGYAKRHLAQQKEIIDIVFN